MNETEHQVDSHGELTQAGPADGSVSGHSPEDDGSGHEPPQVCSDNRLLTVLFNIRVPIWLYILRAGLISLVPSLVVAFALAWVGLANEQTLPQFDKEVGAAFLFVGTVIVSPVLETLVLPLGLWLFSFVTRRPVLQALGSCVLWAILHSLWAPAWGLGVIWPWFVFSCAYLAWRRKSRWHALGAACGVHMFQNFFPGIAMVAAL